MDFLIREGRECVDGDMYIIRFGSCGCLTDLVRKLIFSRTMHALIAARQPVGSVVTPRASVAVTRNFDFDFTASSSSSASPIGEGGAYRVSRPV